MKEIEFTTITSQFRTELPCIDGCVFSCVSRSIYRCVHIESNTRCNARITVTKEKDKIIKCSPCGLLQHNHLSKNDAEIYELKAELRKRNKDGLDVTHKDLMNMISEKQLSDEEKRKLEGFRSSLFKTHMSEEQRDSILSKYVLFQTDDIVAYGSKRILQYFPKATVLYMDGTFKSKDEGYKQLYIIKGKVCGRVLPMVFASLKGKGGDI